MDFEATRKEIAAFRALFDRARKATKEGTIENGTAAFSDKIYSIVDELVEVVARQEAAIKELQRAAARQRDDDRAR